MFRYFCVSLMLFACVSSRAVESWFEDCTIKSSKGGCLKCCNDQYEIRVAAVQNRASIVTKNWIKENISASYCPLENATHSESSIVARVKEEPSTKFYCQKLAIGSNNELWTMTQDAENVYLKPKNEQEFKADYRSMSMSQTPEMRQPLTLPIAEINKNAEEEKRKCINRCEKLDVR